MFDKPVRSKNLSRLFVRENLLVSQLCESIARHVEQLGRVAFISSECVHLSNQRYEWGYLFVRHVFNAFLVGHVVPRLRMASRRAAKCRALTCETAPLGMSFALLSALSTPPSGKFSTR